MILRAARSTDAGKLGAIMEDFQTVCDWLPDLWTGAEHIAHAGAMIDRGWVRLAQDEAGQPLGFIARDGEDVVALYVDNDKRGFGVGQALLDEAKTQVPHLVLWAHAANRGGRRFYRRQGFEETGHRTGDATDEGIPAVRYEWRRAKPRKKGDKDRAA